MRSEGSTMGSVTDTRAPQETAAQHGAVEGRATSAYGSIPVQAVESTRRPEAQRQPVARFGGAYAGGLGTSFCGALFADPQHRSDCCHVACCGTLSHDRTQHILWSRAETPNYRSPDWRRRVLLWIVVPVLLIVVFPGIILSFVNESNSSLFLVSALAGVVFMVAMMAHAISVRTTARRKLMLRVLQANAGAAPGRTVTAEAYQRALRSHLNSLTYHNCCAHAVCGCVYEPPIRPSLLQNSDDLATPPPRPDFCTTLFHSIFKPLCCYNCCSCYFQCCGACALAQEEAEMERLLIANTTDSAVGPSRKWSLWIDYITFQPFVEYFPDLLHLRSTKDTSLLKHFQTTSLLSKRLLLALLVYVSIPCIYVFLIEPLLYHGSEQPFNVLNLLVIFGTLAQAFFVVFLVHWVENKFDLSVDAVIKYFASGFLLSTSLAVFFETVLSVVVNFVVVTIAVVEAVIEGASGQPIESYQGSKEERAWEFARQHPGIMVLQYLVTSFLVAALVEELCKYFGFWMVEHPDFIPPAEMEEALVAAETQTSTSGEGTEASGDGLSSPLVPRRNTRTLCSIAAGTTVAMVTTATGFACCENFLYVFFYAGGHSFKTEATTLLLRSILPVHPLAAAMQSIDVCRRDIEGDKKVGIGRIILPALLFHGTFDFVAMVLAYVYDTSHPPSSSSGTFAMLLRSLGYGNTFPFPPMPASGGEDSDHGGLHNLRDADDASLWDALVSLLIELSWSLGLVLLAFAYYFYYADLQRRRIQALDANQT